MIWLIFKFEGYMWSFYEVCFVKQLNERALENYEVEYLIIINCYGNPNNVLKVFKPRMMFEKIYCWCLKKWLFKE